MAGLPAILSAIARVVWRDLRSLDALRANNFFVVSILFLQQAGVFVLVLFALLLLFPLASDPLRKVPGERLALWPASRTGHVLLRVLSIWLSPAVWITVVLVLATQSWEEGLRFLGLAVAIYGLATLFARVHEKAPSWDLLHHVPALPVGWGELVRKSFRDTMSFLDFYCAAALSISGVVYRVAAARPEREALTAISLLVVIALSTYAQTLFAVDSPESFTRYRVLPVRGWQILAAKNIAVLVTGAMLTALLAPLAGIAGSFASLILGNHIAVRKPVHEHRWRFVTGVSILFGLVQCLFIVACGVFTIREAPWMLLPLGMLWIASIWFHGSELERLHGIGTASSWWSGAAGSVRRLVRPVRGG
jgi:hypothetical protein